MSASQYCVGFFHITPVLLPGNFQGQRSLAGYSPWGCKKSDMTEHAHTQHTEHNDKIPLLLWNCSWRQLITSPPIQREELDLPCRMSGTHLQAAWAKVVIVSCWHIASELKNETGFVISCVSVSSREWKWNWEDCSPLLDTRLWWCSHQHKLNLQSHLCSSNAGHRWRSSSIISVLAGFLFWSQPVFDCLLKARLCGRDWAHSH